MKLQVTLHKKILIADKQTMNIVMRHRGKMVGFPNADTTDVQNATVMFVGTRILLTCTFANISSARGCFIKFTLSNNLFEQFNITRNEAQLCSQTDNQIATYGRVDAFDWEADGSEGMVPIRIQPIEALDEQRFTMICPLPGNHYCKCPVYEC